MNVIVSVIVPIYNVEQYLRCCVKSIINQTYRNIEIILVDDGSLDNCGKICDEYAEKDSRIKVIHKNNGGLSSARNAGLDIAKGEYVCFVDSDDWIDKDFISILLSKITMYDADVAVCGFISEYMEKTVKSKFVNNIMVLDRHDAISNLYNENYLNMTVAWNKIYIKKIFNSVQYKVGIINEDENIIHEILYKCSKVVLVDKYLYHYRMRNNSITKTKYSIRNLDSVYAYENRLAFFEKNNEFEFVELTLHMYFRVLLNNCCSIYYSDLDNKSKYFKELKNKIDDNLYKFINLKNIKLSSKVLLISYRIHYRLGIISNRLLNSINN